MSVRRCIENIEYRTLHLYSCRVYWGRKRFQSFDRTSFRCSAKQTEFFGLQQILDHESLRADRGLWTSIRQLQAVRHPIVATACWWSYLPERTLPYWSAAIYWVSCLDWMSRVFRDQWSSIARWSPCCNCSCRRLQVIHLRTRLNLLSLLLRSHPSTNGGTKIEEKSESGTPI